jgi:hypothetical protein
LARTQGEDAGFGPQQQGGAPLGAADPGQRGGEGRSAQSGQKLASVQPENSICHK